jgi:Spy/CpxP family protein refolding chaperone
MKTSLALSLPLLCAGLALTLAPARADTPSAPPEPPQQPAGPDAAPGTDSPAQPPAHHRRPHPMFVLGELTERLSLTPDQQKQVGALIADYDAQVLALRKDTTIAREDKRGKMKAITEATRGKIRAALTPEQQKIFDTRPIHTEHGEPSAAPTPTPAT